MTGTRSLHGRVLLLDDGLRDRKGHNAAYAFGLSEALGRRGITHEIFGHASWCEPSMPNRVKPVFRQVAAEDPRLATCLPGPLRRILRLLWTNFRHFRDLITRAHPQVRRGDLLVILYASNRTSAAYAAWLFCLALSGRRVASIFAVHNLTGERLFQVESGLLHWLALGQNVTHVAHSPDFCKHLERLGGRSCPYVPLPYLPKPEAMEIPQSARDPVRFACLGTFSREKGADVLVEAAIAVADLLDTGSIGIELQCYLHHQRDAGTVALAAKISRWARGNPGVSLIAEALEPSEYLRRLRAAEVVLVLNRTSAFRWAISGVFAEAVALDRPVVVACGTVMAGLVEAWGSGVCFEDGDAASLATAIRRAAGEIDILQTRAANAGRCWRAMNRPERWVEVLESSAAAR